MASTPYTPITFDEGALSVDQMQRLASNQQYLFENVPQMQYNYSGAVKKGKMKVLAGTILIPGTKKTTAYKNTYFGGFFSSGCKPIIATSIAVPGPYNHSIRNLSGKALPDHRGFRVYVWSGAYNSKNRQLKASSRILYIAVGY